MEIKRYLDDFEIGDRAESPGRTVTESDIFRSVGSGYSARVHVDREFIRKETEFEDIIVQNTVLISISNSLWFELPGWEWETPVAYGRDNMRFVNPAYPGDTLSLVAEVTDKRIREKDKNAGTDRGVITINEKLVNQDGELVMINDHLSLLPVSPNE
jgi:acyl dehydratase